MEDVEADRRLAELTAEMAWLQRLARALLQSDDASDVAQETWLIARERGPHDGRPLRPWLSRVALNVVRMQARSRERREARERATESFAESVATPDLLIERVELQRHVAGEVLALDEPYRSTVLLHYFEELPCVEIARKLGIPEATVRGRLKVALARLRKRLAPRKSIAPLFAPLAGFKPASHKTATVAVGMITMKKVVISIVLVLLLVFAGLRWQQRGGRADDNNENSATLRVVLAPTGVRTAGASNVPVWMTQAELPPRRIAGRVEYAGSPVVDATVRLGLDAGAGVILPVAELRSGDGGAFDFGAQPAATFTVSAEVPRRAAASITIAVADPNANPDHLVLVLGDCNVRLTGKVLDASGGPIVKARLTSSSLGGTETDARGEYQLCSAATRAQIRVEADGYGALETEVVLNGSLHQDFRLAPEGVVVGQVITDNNEAVPGARVVVTPEAIERAQHVATGWTIADAGGVFRVSRLAPGRYRLSASAEGLASSTPVDVVVRAGSTSFNTILRVSNTAPVSGRVMMAGKPVVGVRVSAARNGEAITDAVYSQRDGTFVLSSVPVGRVNLVAWPHEVIAPVSVDVDHDGVENLVLEVAKRATIRGRVTRKGAPAAGAEVFIPRVLAVQSDATGHYVLDGLLPGIVQVSAGHSGMKAFTNKSITLSAGDDKTLDIELDFAGEARGIVIDEHGAPVAGVHVRMTSDDRMDFGESTTDADGRFDCFNLAGGDYGFQVFPSPAAAGPFETAGGEPFPSTQVPRDGAVAGITLAIRDERLEIRGVVVDESNAAVADAYVELITRGRGMLTLPAVMTDVSGRFTIENLAPGDYTVHAHGADGSEGFARGVAAGTNDLSIKLAAPGSIEGTLTGFSSPPSVEIALLSTNVRIVTTAIVDGTRFSHRGLRPGRYAVQARANGQVDSAEIEVRSGEITRVELQNRRTGTIEGVVAEFGTKRPIAGMRCEAKLSLAGPPADAAMTAVSDVSGHFAMRAPVGKVRVLCSPSDQSLSITGDDVDVAADATSTVTVTAVRATHGITRGDAGFSLTPMLIPLQLAQVDPAGDAAAAGARNGDQLIAIDGASVRGMLPLTAMFLVMNHRPGTTITIDVLRAGAPMSFMIPVGRSKRAASYSPLGAGGLLERRLLGFTNLDQIPIRVLHVAAVFKLVTLWFGKEFSSLTFPLSIVVLDV